MVYIYISQWVIIILLLNMMIAINNLPLKPEQRIFSCPNTDKNIRALYRKIIGNHKTPKLDDINVDVSVCLKNRTQSTDHSLSHRNQEVSKSNRLSYRKGHKSFSKRLQNCKEQLNTETDGGESFSLKKSLLLPAFNRKQINRLRKVELKSLNITSYDFQMQRSKIIAQTLDQSTIIYSMSTKGNIKNPQAEKFSQKSKTQSQKEKNTNRSYHPIKKLLQSKKDSTLNTRESRLSISPWKSQQFQLF